MQTEGTAVGMLGWIGRKLGLGKPRGPVTSFDSETAALLIEPSPFVDIGDGVFLPRPAALQKFETLARAHAGLIAEPKPVVTAEQTKDEEPAYRRGPYPKRQEWALGVIPIIKDVISAGADTYHQVGLRLNERGVTTRLGSPWNAKEAKRFILDFEIPFQTKGKFPQPPDGRTKRTAPSKPAKVRARRFRRTVEEIALGLTKEQAMERRQKGPEKAVQADQTPKVARVAVRCPQPSLPVQKPKGEQVDVTNQVTAAKGFEFDPISMLSPRIQVRARAMAKNKKAGKPILTAAELDEIERRVMSGQVTKLPAGIDSEGFNHFTREMAQ
jgi:hypothetical protein